MRAAVLATADISSDTVVASSGPSFVTRLTPLVHRAQLTQTTAPNDEATVADDAPAQLDDLLCGRQAALLLDLRRETTHKPICQRAHIAVEFWADARARAVQMSHPARGRREVSAASTSSTLRMRAAFFAIAARRSAAVAATARHRRRTAASLVRAISGREGCGTL